MPNIEMHGYSDAIARIIRDRIIDALSPAPYAMEVVITRVRNDVHTLGGMKSPFIRIVSTADSIAEVKKDLAIIGEDMELMLLP